MMEQKMVYQIKEVQKIMGLSRNTVNHLIEEGRLKAVKSGPRRYIIPTWALEKFLQQANN